MKQLKKIRTHKNSFCMICKSQGVIKYQRLKDRLFGVKGSWQIRECSNLSCRHLWLDPSPVKEDIHLAYAQYFTHQDKPHSNISLLQKIVLAYQARHYQYPIKNIKRIYTYLSLFLSHFKFFKEYMDYPFVYFKGLKKGKFLELGAGSGEMLSQFKDLGFDTEGLDLDLKAVMRAKQKGLKVHHGDIFSRKFKANHYDIIFSSHFIEHVPDPLRVMKEALDTLKQGGVFIAITPNISSFLHRCLKSKWLNLDPPRHLHMFNADQLRKLMHHAGYKTIEVKSGNYSAATVFYYSLNANYWHNRWSIKALVLSCLSLIVRLCLNILHYFYPLSGEEIILIAKK
jgi:SAM-dependent methyltransferase